MDMHGSKRPLFGVRSVRNRGSEAAADQAIQARGGDVREAVKALLIAVDFLEAQAAELRAAVSAGYARGRFELARDRKE
jgi:stage V sporulation protein SpoVS